MAPLRYRSTGPVTRSNQAASKQITGQTRITSAAATDPEDSHQDHQHEEGKPEFNQVFIEFEQLLPNQESATGKSITPAPNASLERSQLTPGTPIKVERESLTDIYDASPRNNIYQAASLGQRQQSRSTAQLSTPISSPEGGCSRCSPIERGRMVKLESKHNDYGRQDAVGSSSTPASSPITDRPSKKPVNRRVPTTPAQSPPTILQRPATSEDMRESPDRENASSSTATLSENFTSDILCRTQIRALPTYRTRTFSSRSNQSQKDRQQAAKPLVGEQSQRIEPPPILPPPKAPPKVPPPSRTVGSTAVPTQIVPTSFSTPKRTLHVREKNKTKMTCCKMMCSQCTPRDVWEEYGLGPPENRPSVSRLKSLSACPSSVLSFASNDDVRPLDEMYREAGRALNDSTKGFASKRLSEISPLLKYNDRSMQFGGRFSIAANKVNGGDIHDNNEAGNLSQKDPCRMLFGRARKCVTDKRGIDLIDASQHAQVIGEGIEEVPSRALRSFTASSLSKKVPTEEDSINQTVEETTLISLLANEEHGEGEDSSSEFEDGPPGKSPARAPQGVKKSSQSMKRARETIDDWQPIFSDNEPMMDEEDLVEINRDVFAESENRRKKRHKSQPGDNDTDSTLRRAILKEEDTGTEDEGIPSRAEDRQASQTVNMDDTDYPEHNISPCDYYMHTYWDSGRAPDGRRARDGFIIYTDFKAYCRKWNQQKHGLYVLFRRDLKHLLSCAYHARLRPKLLIAAYFAQHNPNFNFQSCAPSEETRRVENEAIGNEPSPGGGASRIPPAGGGGGGSGGGEGRVFEELLKEVERLRAEDVAHSEKRHAEDIARLTKRNKMLESKVKEFQRKSARSRRR